MIYIAKMLQKLSPIYAKKKYECLNFNNAAANLVKKVFI